jgi:aerobic carbon-monoxide dehydrogenase large subunit
MPPAKTPPTKFGFGGAVVRKEDDALIRGAGRYVADHAPNGALHGIVLRSPHAHARFRIADVAKPKAMPGVALVLTGADTAKLGDLPCQGAIPGTKVAIPPYPILARDEVKHVGDAVAFVVADTPDRARDAAEAIAIEWDALPHVVGAAAALDKGAPAVWPKFRGNLAFETVLGDAKATARAFAKAARTVSLTLVNQRLVANYLDTRGVVAEYDGDRITLTLSSQGSHSVRDVLCADVLEIEPAKMRVVTPDVGGGFGTKLFPYREYALAAFAARRLERPVKWVADRAEHFLGDAQGRDNVTTAKLALDGDGRFLALDIDLVADMGAYLSCYAPFIPFIGAGMSPGVYDIPACHVRVRGAFTNTVPVDAYRGAGRPEAAYVIERLVDVAAHEIGVAPDALRRKNFIKATPYTTATGKTYDSGDFAGHLARAQEAGDWQGFERRLARSRDHGRLRGIGIATYIEACGNNGPDTARVRLDDDGGVTVLTGTQSTGQGHATAFAQIIADHLGLAPERVRMIQGDTDLIATGTGTGGSSSIPCGGASVAGAARKLARKLKDIAADTLEAAPGDLEIADGAVRVAGTDRMVSFADLARSPKARGRPLMADDAFTPEEATYPNGTHLAEVEIDPETGATRILRYLVVDDFGATLNPLLLAGQVHGGTVQGIGQALMENTVYDRESGQLVSASLMDYALPRADDIPPFAFETRNVPCRTNPLGVKGAGEAGAIGSCPAVMNAVADALWRAYRIRHVDMPATPERLWAAIAEGRRLHTL